MILLRSLTCTVIRYNIWNLNGQIASNINIYLRYNIQTKTIFFILMNDAKKYVVPQVIEITRESISALKESNLIISSEYDINLHKV